MNAPTLTTRVFGSIAARCFTYPLAVLAGWDWLTGTEDPGVNFALLILAAFCGHEAKKLNAYRAWKAEWEGYGYPSPRPSFWTRLFQSKLFRLWVIACWWNLAVLVAFCFNPDDATGRFFIYGGLFGMIAHLGVRIWLWNRGKPSPARKNSGPAVVCVPVPTASPNARQVVYAMPDYARELILRSADTAPPPHARPTR